MRNTLGRTCALPANRSGRFTQNLSAGLDIPRREPHPGYCRMAMHTKSRMNSAETIQTIGCTSLAFLRHTLTMQ